MNANEKLESVFVRLREILKKQRGWKTDKDSATEFGIAGEVGPTTLRLWKGKMKYRHMPIGWVKIGKAYVSYHLMGVYVNSPLMAGISKGLRMRMQGKSCFNFTKIDPALFAELETLTAASIKGMKSGGYLM